MAGHSHSPDVDTDHIPGDEISARHERLTDSAEELPSRVDVICARSDARERGESGATTSRESGDELHGDGCQQLEESDDDRLAV